MTLVVNPFGAILEPPDGGAAADGGPYLEIMAPKPGKSLLSTRVYRAKEPALYGALATLPREGAGPLDVPVETAREHGSTLRKMGLLVSRGEAPRWRGYACPLTSARSGAFAAARSTRAGRRGLPNAIRAFRRLTGDVLDHPAYFAGPPSVAARDPVTDLVFPYWATQDTLSLLAPKRCDANVRRGLRKAGIPVDAEDLAGARRAWRTLVEQARGELEAKGYATVNGAIPSAHLGALRRFYGGLFREGFLPFDPEDGRFVKHNDAVARTFLVALLPLIGRVTGRALKPSYTYLSIYPRGASLARHTDRPQCEYTVSLLLDFAPRGEDELAWPIHLEVPGRGETVSLRQARGDMMIFRGREIPHWRAPLRAASQSVHLFFHYVGMDFAGPLD